MPELPEVENVRMSLEPKLTNRTVTNVRIINTIGIKGQDAQVFMDRVDGIRLTTVNRRGKYLIVLAHKENDEFFLITHLAMAGRILAVGSLGDTDPVTRKHTHVVLTLDDGMNLIYSDYRHMGGMRILTRDEFHDERVNGSILRMGPEPFWDDARSTFIANVRRKTHIRKRQPDGTWVTQPITIKEAIMDQTNLAGVGNIYACEALWDVGLNPFTPVTDLSDERLDGLFDSLRRIMTLSVRLGGTSVRDYVNGEGRMGNFQYHLRVYNRRTCPRCGSEIIRDRTGRTTHFCPNCQG